MAYTAQTWTNDVSKLNATRMTVIETGISDIHNLVTAKGDLYTATASGVPAKLAAGVDNTVLVSDSAQSTGNKWANITNSMVDAAAAIAYSKLNLADSIVNADISSSAAIALSKLASAAWSSYTPTWSSEGVAPAIGDGTIAGTYMQIGKLVIGTIKITMGASTTYGSGLYHITLPVTAKASLVGGTVNLSDATGDNYVGAALAKSTTQIYAVVADSTTDKIWTATKPFTAAQSDYIIITFAYEAA